MKVPMGDHTQTEGMGFCLPFCSIHLPGGNKVSESGREVFELCISPCGE